MFFDLNMCFFGVTVSSSKTGINFNKHLCTGISNTTYYNAGTKVGSSKTDIYFHTAKCTGTSNTTYYNAEGTKVGSSKTDIYFHEAKCTGTSNTTYYSTEGAKVGSSKTGIYFHAFHGTGTSDTTYNSTEGVKVGSSKTDIYFHAFHGTGTSNTNYYSPEEKSVIQSSSAFFSGVSSLSKISLDSKTKATTRLDEKECKRLMPFQNELIKACENGSLSGVKAALAKGAQPDLPNEQGKHPIYAAVWGMNPELVRHLIRLLKEGVNPISWEECEVHNEKHYSQLFLNMKFKPIYYRNWYDLLNQIEPNEFLSDYHLTQVQKSWGRWDVNCASIEALQKYAYSKEDGGRAKLDQGTALGRFLGMKGPITSLTEEGYEASRNQIKQLVKELQAAKKTQYTGLNPSLSH